MVSCAAWEQDTLYVSTLQVVHLRFASELKYVNLGSGDIVAKIVDGSKDFVAVKAREAFDFCTSMSCRESNGEMHTFLVGCREHPSRLDIDTRGAHNGTGHGAQTGNAVADTTFSFSSFQDIAAMKQELYHIGTGGAG